MTGKKVSSFKERLSELVDSSSKSQSVIAGDLGIAKQTLSAWITGQNSPRTPMVNVLAEYFNVSAGWLLGFDCERLPDKKLNDDWDQYIQEKLNEGKPKTEEARIVSHGIDQLPKAQREMVLNVVRAMFTEHADLFTKGNEEENDDA